MRTQFCRVLSLAPVLPLGEYVPGSRAGAVAAGAAKSSSPVTTMETVLQDIRFAIRGLGKRPGFAIAAILTLALGVGASTAVFNLVAASLFPKLPVREADRLAAIFQYENEQGYFSSLSYPAYFDYSEGVEAFASVAAYSGVPLNLTEGGQSQRVQGELVSANYFSVLGVTPSMGRGFVNGEDRNPGSHPVAIVSYGAWRQLFGSDPALVGRTVRLNGHSFTVVGVAPESFHGLELGNSTDIWIPLSMRAEAMPTWSDEFFYGRGTHWLSAVGRLKPGVTFALAEQQAGTLAASLADEFPDTQANWSARLLPISEATLWPGLRGELAGLASMLVAVVGLTLVLACANVANMLLGRVAARREELAVRLALGANRSRVARQLLAETLVLSLPAGAAGLLAALWISDLMASFRMSRFLPADLDLAPDLRTVAFLVLLTLAVSFLVGLIPAIQAAREDLSHALRAGGAGRAGAPGKARFSSSLSVAQIAASLVVIACAALLVRSAMRQLDIEIGFDSQRVALLSVDLALSGYGAADGTALYQDITKRIEAVPGVRSASAARIVPLGWYRFRTRVAALDGGADAATPRATGGNVVAPGFFETLDIPIVRGRAFDQRDIAGAPLTVVVSEAMARRYWPDRDPLGKRIVLQSTEETLLEVVGVARDIQHGRVLQKEPPPFFYLPLYQNYQSRAALHVRTDGDPLASISSIRAAVAELDPDLPLYEVTTLQQHVYSVTSPAYVAAMGVGVLGALGLLLAAVGIYAVISHAVVLRTHEIGIRIALGAEPRMVVRHVLGQGLVLLAFGVGIGAVVALAASRILGGSLFGVDPSDPMAIALAALLTTAATLLAVYLPARRVTKIDPILALRAE